MIVPIHPSLIGPNRINFLRGGAAMLNPKIWIAFLLPALACGCVGTPDAGTYFSRRAADFSEVWMVGAGYGYGVHGKAYTVLFPVSYGYSRTHEFGWDGRRPVHDYSWYRESAGAFLPPVGFADVELLSSRAADWDEFRGETPPGDCEYYYVVDCCALQAKEPVVKTSKGDSRYDTMLGLEATAGVASARLGIDPVQFIDFVLGCLGLDIVNDDGRAAPPPKKNAPQAP